MAELRSVFRNPMLQCHRCRRVLSPLASQPHSNGQCHLVNNTPCVESINGSTTSLTSASSPLLSSPGSTHSHSSSRSSSSRSSSSRSSSSRSSSSRNSKVKVKVECSNRRYCQKIITEESEVKAQLAWLNQEISFLQQQKDQIKAIVDQYEQQRRQKAEAKEKQKREEEEKRRIETLKEEQRLKAYKEAIEKKERERKEKIRQDMIARIVEIEGKNEMVFRRLILAAVKTVDKEVQESRQKEEEEGKRLEQDFRLDRRGKYMACCLDESDFVSKNFNESVSCVSIGGNGTIMLYEDGSWTCTPGIPKLLYNELTAREMMSLPAPTYVALGSFERYYIQFEDGNNLWVGCDEMAEALQHELRTVRSVAFGKYWDSYFIVFDDGYWICNNIPNALTELIRTNKCCDTLSCVSLGPNGQFYLSAKNGYTWWGGSRTEQMNTIDKYQNRIEFLDFGDNYTYILRYT